MKTLMLVLILSVASSAGMVRTPTSIDCTGRVIYTMTYYPNAPSTIYRPHAAYDRKMAGATIWASVCGGITAFVMTSIILSVDPTK